VPICLSAVQCGWITLTPKIQAVLSSFLHESNESNDIACGSGRRVGLIWEYKMKYKDDWKPFGTSVDLLVLTAFQKDIREPFVTYQVLFSTIPSKPWPANGTKALFKTYTGCGISCLRSQTHDFSVNHTVQWNMIEQFFSGKIICLCGNWHFKICSQLSFA